MRNLKLSFDKVNKATSDEEAKTKAYLDEKLKIEQDHIDLDAKLKERIDKMEANRDDIIKFRVKNS